MDEGSFATNFELSSPFHCSISKLETKSLTGNQTRDRMLSSNSTTELWLDQGTLDQASQRARLEQHYPQPSKPSYKKENLNQ